jgi:hypothetical protein
MLYENDNTSESEIGSQSMESKIAITENGKTKTEIISVTLTIRALFAPEMNTVIQMNKDNTILSQEEYTPDSFPDTFTPNSETEYIIVETKKQVPANPDTTRIYRDIYSISDESITTFCAREDHICEERETPILWSK